MQQWHARKRVLIAEMIEQELAPGERGAFLIWSDPSLYDQTVRDELLERRAQLRDKHGWVMDTYLLRRRR